MGSSSQSATDTETNNLALDKSATLGEGQQILDSVIIDPSDKVMISAFNKLEAGFQVLTSNSTLQMGDMIGLAEELMTLTENQSVRMDNAAAMQLKSGLDYLKVQQEGGKYVIELADHTTEQAFGLAKGIAANNSDLSSQALDLVKDIKTSDYTQTLKTLAVYMGIFGLAAMTINRK